MIYYEEGGGNKEGKKFTLASKLALVGGLLILLNPYLGIYFWVGRPGTGVGLFPGFWFIATYWLVRGVVIMVCAVMLKFKPRYRVAFGAIIIVCSLLSYFWFLPLTCGFSLEALWTNLMYPGLFFVHLGVVLGFVGGLWTMFGEKGKIETRELSKEEQQELTEEEYEKLTEEEKRTREEYERLIEEIDVVCFFHLE